MVSRKLTGAVVLRLVLSAAMFVPIAIIGCAVVAESLGLPTPADDSSVVLVTVVGGSICGLIVGFATRDRRYVNAVMAMLGLVGAIGFGIIALHMATVNSAASGLVEALPSAIATVLYGIAAATCLLAVAVGSLGLICQRRSHRS